MENRDVRPSSRVIAGMAFGGGAFATGSFFLGSLDWVDCLVIPALSGFLWGAILGVDLLYPGRTASTKDALTRGSQVVAMAHLTSALFWMLLRGVVSPLLFVFFLLLSVVETRLVTLPIGCLVAWLLYQSHKNAI